MRQLNLPMADIEQQFRRVAFNIIARNQMTMNGKPDAFKLADFRACAKAALLKRARAEAIIEEVRAGVGRWPEFADAAKLKDALRDRIQSNLRLNLPPR